MDVSFSTRCRKNIFIQEQKPHLIRSSSSSRCRLYALNVPMDVPEAATRGMHADSHRSDLMLKIKTMQWKSTESLWMKFPYRIHWISNFKGFTPAEINAL